MALKGTEFESLQPFVEKAVLKYCSGRDSVMNCAYKCILKKYEKRKMADKLSSHLDSSKASKLASKLNDILYEFEEEHKKKKRKNGEEKSSSSAKRAKFQEEAKENGSKASPPEPEEAKEDVKEAPVDVGTDEAAPKASVLTADQIREMMENTKKIIMERKKLLEQSAPMATPGAPLLPVPPATLAGFPLMQRPPRQFGAQQVPRYQNFHPRHPANANFRLDAVANVKNFPRGPIPIALPSVVAPGPRPGIRLPPPAVVTPTQLDGGGDTSQTLVDLQAEIKSKMGALGITVNAFPDKGPVGKVPPLMPPVGDAGKRSMFDVTAVPRQPTAPQPGKLRLDDKGRMVDAEGNVIMMVGPQPELKANLRAVKKRDAEGGTQSVVKGEAMAPLASGTSDSDQPAFFDARVNMKNQMRTGRRLKFNEPGKFVKIGTQLRMKAQLQKVQNEINALAKKTGISAVTKLALATSSIQKADKLLGLDDVPDVEWWDVIVLKGQSYGETDEEIKANVNETRITHLIEHPLRVADPGRADEDVALPIFLTKRELKKRRRQNRRETWKEKQEKIRLGLEAAPEPKMTISNLMRVLGTDAVQDPTKVEAHVREQMAKRQKKHLEENAARKLTKDQIRDKKIKKVKEDVSRGVRVCVYRVRALTNQSKKFKVEMNCKQLLMTGAVVLHKETNVVVVEGGPKQQKKFKHLMLQRIRWHEERVVKKDAEDEKPNASSQDDDDEDNDRQGLPEADRNKCVLVWDGIVKERAFGEIAFKICPTESYARDYFKKRGVEHYWDLAYSGTILEAAEEDF